MRVGVQFTGTVQGNESHRWFTFNWPADWDMTWMVVPTTVRSGAPEIDWDVAVERASPTTVTYWITIRNLTSSPVDIESRYVIYNAN